MAQFRDEKKNLVAKDELTFHKINRICDALRAELERVNQDNFYLLPILTTYIKK